MLNKQTAAGLGASLFLLLSSCTLPAYLKKDENRSVPATYNGSRDTANTGSLKWREFFTDPDLVALIDSALKKNQELNIVQQEIRMAQNEVRARKGEYLPFVEIGAGAGVEKTPRYTRNGAVEASTDIAPGTPFPEPLPDLGFGARVTWEADVWKKLRNAKKSAVTRYLSSVDGRNFMVTSLIAEIASAYYELLALDNQLDLLKQNIEIQSNALDIVKMEKEATRVTELAVRRFEAEVLHSRSLQYSIQQQITEKENRINFLAGRFPQPVQRSSQTFTSLLPETVYAGLPTQLLENRPDIRKAEKELLANKLDVKAAKANFYPSLRISAAAGYQAFDPSYLLKTPLSLLYSLAGEIAAPLINRNSIKAAYYTANARQVQAAYNYERTVLMAYMEVANQLSNINNLSRSYELKSSQVQALTQSIAISTNLFKSARADYMEVLLTQRDALQSKFELVENRMQQLNARVSLYKALGGGWR